MSLSSNVVAQFVKMTNDTETPAKENIVYGTAVKRSYGTYVRIDGSDQLTPMTTTADVKDGERVTVMIKNHTAVITGNISSPAARTDDVKELANIVADKVSTKELEAESAEIKKLVADNLEATNAKIESLESEDANIKKLVAEKADVKDLETTNAKITNLESEDANIKKLVADKADITDLNATNAKINNLEAEDANIKNLVSQKASITDLNATNAEITNLKAKDAEIDKLVAEKADITDLNAANAKITNLETNKLDANQLSAEVAKLGYAEVEDLEAESAKIEKLESDFGSFETATANRFAANEASIDNLEANKLSATQADLKYANIDFSNIQMAAVEELFTKSGIIKDLVVGDQSITGELVGVTIKGDLIEAGTLKADKLVVKGSDGLFYKLNVEAGGLSAEEAPTESLHGSIITANSITATKINVDDLVAFDATIGGFKITENSIYSGVKESVNNTTRGIYLDNDGQIAFGNASQYVKFYQVSGDVYKLAIAADGIFVGDEQKNVEKYMEEVKQSAQANAEDLTNYISATNKELANLQGQIDGSIMTWFYEYVPTNTNKPASDWTTTDLKSNHLGDLFYDTITGYCYRWQVQNNQYFWTRITDVDVTKALADAKAAQDTADNKRRVFVSTPIPPYDIGDLWTQGTGGDLMRCQTAKTANQSYAVADWVKASKYTDDTTANEVKADVNALTTRVTNAETSITKTNEEIALRATKTEVTEAIDNIEIGGRNLLPHSKLDGDSSNWKYGNVTSNFEDGYLKLTKAETTARGYCNQNGISLPQVGRYYTVSIDAMKLPDVDIPADTSVFIRYVLNETIIAELIIRIPTDLSEGVWTKLSNTFLYDDEIPSYVQATIALGKPAGGLALRHFKYEMGNKPTDWTPAPEDMASKEEMSSAIEQNAESITLSVDKKLENYSTTTEMNSAIEQKANSITSTVAATYTTKDEFNNLEIGGLNLLLKSDTPITTSAYQMCSYYFGDKKPIEGETYTVTIKGTLGDDRTDFRVYNSGGSIMFGILKDIGNGLYSYTGTWNVRYSSGTTAANTHILVYHRPNGGASESTIEWIKLEKGNKRTDWTPAPEDELNSLEIGGTNIFADQYVNPNVSGNSKDGYRCSVYGQQLVLNESLVQMLEPNTEYTIQYKYKLLSMPEYESVVGSSAQTRLYLHSGVAGYSPIYLDSKDYSTLMRELREMGEGDVIKHSLTFTTPAGLHDSEANYRLLSYSLRVTLEDGTQVTCDGLFYDIKIERGNKPTDYSPSPKDYLTSIETTSAIEQTADSIKLEVSKTYTTKDEFNDLEVGGRNLIHGSSGDWSEWITPKANSDNVCYTPVNAYLSEDETEVGDPFMCSFEVEFSGVSAGTGGAFRFLPQGAMDDAWNKGQLWYGVFITEPPADGIYRYEMKRSITESQVGTVKVGCGFRCDYWDGVGKYRFRRMKLERGNKATAWSPAPEDVEADISEVYETITEQNTSITQTCNDIVLEATSTCVQNGEYEAYKESVQLQIDGQNQEIAMNFATTSQQIADNDAATQAKFANIDKHITFSENGILISSGENGIVLEIDNDGISFRRSDSKEPFGFWDGEEFLTGNIFVKTNEQARFGNFAYLPRDDGSLMFKKVGD